MRPVRNAADTKRRLMVAATAEFAEFGLAGARVDRIAATAQCNKQSLYSYFGSKEALFDAAFDAMVGAIVHDVPIDADDLPNYAVRLYDHYRARPEVMRLAVWYQLERSASAFMPQSGITAGQQKVAMIRAAQQRGRVSRHFAAEDLLALIHKISAGAPLAPEATPDQAAHDHFREIVRDVVARLVAI